MSKNKFNVKLLRNLVLWAQGEHDRLGKKYAGLAEYKWDQAYWAKEERNGVCRTAFCIAGAAVRMKGYKFVWAESADPQLFIAETCTKKIDGVKRSFDIELTAMHLLGIDWDQAESLFNGDNTIDDVIDVAESIAEYYGETLFPGRV